MLNSNLNILISAMVSPIIKSLTYFKILKDTFELEVEQGLASTMEKILSITIEIMEYLQIIYSLFEDSKERIWMINLNGEPLFHQNHIWPILKKIGAVEQKEIRLGPIILHILNLQKCC